MQGRDGKLGASGSGGGCGSAHLALGGEPAFFGAEDVEVGVGFGIAGGKEETNAFEAVGEAIVDGGGGIWKVAGIVPGFDPDGVGLEEAAGGNHLDKYLHSYRRVGFCGEGARNFGRKLLTGYSPTVGEAKA